MYSFQLSCPQILVLPSENSTQAIKASKHQIKEVYVSVTFRIFEKFLRRNVYQELQIINRKKRRFFGPLKFTTDYETNPCYVLYIFKLKFQLAF